MVFYHSTETQDKNIWIQQSVLSLKSQSTDALFVVRSSYLTISWVRVAENVPRLTWVPELTVFVLLWTHFNCNEISLLCVLPNANQNMQLTMVSLPEFSGLGISGRALQMQRSGPWVSNFCFQCSYFFLKFWEGFPELVTDRLWNFWISSQEMYQAKWRVFWWVYIYMSVWEFFQLGRSVWPLTASEFS